VIFVVVIIVKNKPNLEVVTASKLSHDTCMVSTFYYAVSPDF
jgi:hypothetical protein